MVAVEGFVEAFAQTGKHADFLQYGHGHQDAEEEHNGAEVDAGQQVAHTLGHSVVFGCVMMEDFGDCPEDTQHEQDAHERRQMGECLEDRNKDETAHAEPEDDVALHLGELTDIGCRQVLTFIELSIERILQDKGRDDHRDE